MKIDVDPFQVSDDMYAEPVDCLVVEASTKVYDNLVVKATEYPNIAKKVVSEPHYDENK